MPTESGATPPHQRPGFLDLVEMWDALLVGGWDSLAVVPTDHQVSSDLVVLALETSVQKRPGGVRILDARGADAPASKRLAGEFSTAIVAGERVVVLVDSLMRSLSGVHLLQSVGAVLLVIRVAGMDLESVSSTIALIGSERILGSVTAPADT
jgi:hypothetical protein